MKPAPFHYHAPRSLEEALAILAEVAPLDGRILAGGQSLMPAMAFRMARPGHLVDINGIAGADRLALRDGWLHVGPCVRHAALGAQAAPGPLGALLGVVQRHIAHDPIRRRGTMCGSLANADPASEWCLLAAALGAEMTLASQNGSRQVVAAAFLQGIMSTALRPEEMLTEIRLPLLAEDACTGFYEFSRRAGDFAQAMAIAVFTLRDGRIVAPRLALGAIEDRARRLPDAEAVLDGQVPGAALFRAAAAAARPGLLPLDADPYRLDLAETAMRRALALAAGIAA